MGAVIGLFTTKIGRILGALLAAATILIGAVQYGRKAQREDDRVEDLEDFIETKKEIDNVEAAPDSDTAFERLRTNGWLR